MKPDQDRHLWLQWRHLILNNSMSFRLPEQLQEEGQQTDEGQSNDGRYFGPETSRHLEQSVAHAVTHRPRSPLRHLEESSPTETFVIVPLRTECG